MPVEITQKCMFCHTPKLRDTSFPSQVVGKTKRGGLKRMWMTFCFDCIARYPELLSDPERLPQRLKPSPPESENEL